MLQGSGIKGAGKDRREDCRREAEEAGLSWNEMLRGPQVALVLTLDEAAQ